MRSINKLAGTMFAAAAALSLTACGGGEEADADNTVVTDLDPMDGNAVDDTTVIDATLGAEESMGMENAMPADTDEATATDDNATEPPANSTEE